jgi:hypothetical protein
MPAKTEVERASEDFKESIEWLERELSAKRAILADLPKLAECSQSEIAEYIRRRIIIEKLRISGDSANYGAFRLGTSGPTIGRYLRLWAQVQRTGNHRLLLPKKSSGRPRKA